jgi:hypothetical protein
VKPTEQIARSAYETLTTSDQEVARAWRRLGNDWFTSMVNGGVPLSSRRPRVYPSQAQRTEPRACNAHG